MAPEPRVSAAGRARAAIGGYLERHAQTCVASLGRLLREPLGAALTIGVISLALAIPACLYLLVQNARSVGDVYADALDVTVYLKSGESELRARALAEQIGRRADVASSRLVTAAEGLAQFREWSGFGTALDALKDNPLPHAVVVRPRLATAGSVDRLQEALTGLPGVDSVRVDAAWVRRFLALLDVLRRTLLILAVVLGSAVLVVVGNTIRLDIDVRRPEIEVTKLVGGSDAFVRRPFLYGGLWYGLGGGLVAALVVSAFRLGLSGPVQRVAAAYGSRFTLQGLDAAAVAVLIGGGAALGWAGAYVAATWHLRRIEPSGEH
jgi:cell division transport system permease protein